MPRRGSRAQLVRDLATYEARSLSNFYEIPVDPGDVALSYRHFSTDHLAWLVAREEIEPKRRGRPKGRRPRKPSPYVALLPQVDAALATGKRSVRGACAKVAHDFGVSAEMLRKLYRRRH